MKSSLLTYLLFLSGAAHASQIAQCNGTSDLDGSPVTAKVFLDSGAGRIRIETTIDSVESATAVEALDRGAYRIHDNAFQMDFTLAPGVSATDVLAFRGGAFFVDDFSCRE